jgi:hypothetical protein
MTARGFSMMVNLHIFCTLIVHMVWQELSGQTTPADPSVFLFVADAWRKKFMPQVQMRWYNYHIQVDAADIMDLPRQLGASSNIQCADKFTSHRKNPLITEYSEVTTEKC